MRAVPFPRATHLLMHSLLAGLTSTLPASLSSLNLTDFKADLNQLSGTLPGAWGMNGGFRSISLLNLSSNELSGTIPPWTSMGNLSSLDLSNNR